MQNNPSVKYLRSINWEEVFLLWYLNEGQTKSWQDLAHERGFASWAEWRLDGYTKRFGCAQANWGLYEISNPTKFASKLYGGPFRTWIDKYYNGKQTKQFSELATQANVQQNNNVLGIINNFPDQGTIICLEVGDRIFTIEGSHRCCALAIMDNQKLQAPENLTFAIGKSTLKELPPIGKNTTPK